MMFQVRTLRINSLGGVTRTTREYDGPGLFAMLEVLIANPSSLIEFTVTPTASEVVGVTFRHHSEVDQAEQQPAQRLHDPSKPYDPNLNPG